MKHAVHAVIIYLLFSAQVSWADFKVLIIDTGLSTKRTDLTKYVADSYKNTDYEDTHSLGHGTHITSIILKNACPEVKIIPCRFYFEREGQIESSSENVVKCLTEGLKENVDMVNMSLNGARKDLKEAAVLKAYEMLNIPVHVALGNDYNKFGYGEGTFPADLNYSNIVKIGGLEDGLFSRATNIRSRSVFLKESLWAAGKEPGKKALLHGTSQATAYYTSLKIKKYCQKSVDNK